MRKTITFQNCCFDSHIGEPVKNFNILRSLAGPIRDFNDLEESEMTF